MVGVLEARGDDPVAHEIRAFVNALDEDQQIDLMALTLVGRGDCEISEWAQARQQTAGAHNDRTADDLLGSPLLPEFLEDALNDTGRSCEDEKLGRLQHHWRGNINPSSQRNQRCVVLLTNLELT